MLQTAVRLCAFMSLLIIAQDAREAAQVAGEAAEGSSEDEEFLRGAVRDAYRGDARRARRDLREYLSDFPDSLRALEALTRLELDSGRAEEALKYGERLANLTPRHASAIALLARLNRTHGRYVEAERVLREGIGLCEQTLELEACLAALLHYTGRRDDANTLVDDALGRIGDFGDLSGDELCSLARLYHITGDMEKAARAAVFADAALNGRKGPNYRHERFEPLLILGELYRISRLESGNRALAAYDDVFKISPDQTDALLGRAETRLYGRNLSGALEDCERVLMLNPIHLGALAFKARLLIRNGRYGDAMELIEKGLALNGLEKSLLAQKAACLCLRGETAESEKALRAAFEVDAFYGAGYMAVGEALLYHYRFGEARDYFRKSIALDADLNEAYILLARSSVNLGLEEEAEKTLKESKLRDPYNHPWRYNMLKILDELKRKKRVRAGTAIFLFDVDEWGVMEHYLPALFEQSWARFEKRYGISPKGPILVEMFSDHEDFAVRTVGFTGLGALGACFGDVLTLLSPRTGGFRREFNWVSTLHHEIAHTFTLKLSRHRVPRWLTEGFSVYEEQAIRKTWDRDMQFDLFNAYHNDRLIPIRSFNAAFHGSRVLFAYYQAGLFVKYIEETYGWDALLTMLKAYGRDVETEAALAEALGESRVGPEARTLDSAFRAWIGENIIASIDMIPAWSDRKRREFVDAVHRSPRKADLLARAAWACYSKDKIVDARYYLDRLIKEDPRNASGLCLSGTLAVAGDKPERAEECFRACLEQGGGNFYVYLNLGNLAAGRDEDGEAASFYEKALEAFSGFVGRNNPYELLVRLYSRNDEKEKAIRILRSFVDIVEHDFANRIDVARYYTEKDRLDEAVVLFREAVEVDPFVRSVHLEMGRALAGLGRFEEALDEFDVAILVKPYLELPPGKRENAPGEDYDTLAEILVARASAFLSLGRRAEALEDIEKALSCRPDYQEAIDLRKTAGE